MLNKGPKGPGFGLGLKPWHYTASRDTRPRSSSVDYAWQEPGEVSLTSRDTGPRSSSVDYAQQEHDEASLTSGDTGSRSSCVDCTWQEPGEVMDLNIDPERSWIRLLAIE